MLLYRCTSDRRLLIEENMTLCTWRLVLQTIFQNFNVSAQDGSTFSRFRNVPFRFLSAELVVGDSIDHIYMSKANSALIIPSRYSQ